MRKLSFKIIFLILASLIIPIISQAQEPERYSKTTFTGKETKLFNPLFFDTVQKPAKHIKYLKYKPYYFKYFNDKRNIGINKAMSLNIVGFDNQDDKDSNQLIQESNGPGEPIKNNKKPPLNGRKIMGEISAGVLSGFIVGGIGGLIGVLLYIYIDPRESEDPWNKAFGIYEWMDSGIFIGYALGSAIGVYWVGSAGNETGSFLATLGGSILGFAVGFAHTYYYHDENAILVFVNPPIFATVAFNLTRKYESSSNSSAALINFKDGNMNLAFPIVYCKPDSYNGKLIYSMDLVRVKF